MAAALGSTLAIPVNCPRCPQPFKVTVDVSTVGRTEGGRQFLDVSIDHEALRTAVRAHFRQHGETEC